jgi:hypothetical protein
MSTIAKTPVEVVQELIAVHTTRKEVTEKIKTTGLPRDFEGVLSAAEKQSREFIKELLGELSNYGDGVMAAVERDDEYHKIWKEALLNIDSAPIEDRKKIFFDLEESLKKVYRDILEAQTDLPPAVTEIVNRQFAQVQKNA